MAHGLAHPRCLVNIYFSPMYSVQQNLGFYRRKQRKENKPRNLADLGFNPGSANLLVDPGEVTF
jgi:hypothetical protein